MSRPSARRSAPRRPGLPTVAAATVAATVILGARETPAQTFPAPSPKGVLRVGMRIGPPPQPKSAPAQAPSPAPTAPRSR